MARHYSGQRGKRFDEDDGGGWLNDRGVSEVIGSILVFGLLVALLAVVQTQAVPNANEDVEFQHSQQLQQDLSKTSEALSRTATTGSGEAVSVSTGTTYPPRLVLFNPPAPTGDLRSGDRARLGLVNISGTTPETRDYVFGTLGGFDNTSMNTSRLEYRPDYNRYSAAPTTALEYGVAYDETGNQTRIESANAVVDGKQINLRLLGEGVEASGQLSTTLRTEPVSTGEGIPVRSLGDYTGTDSNLTLQLPTRMTESAWRQELLTDAIDDPGGSANAAPEADDTCAIVAADGTLVESSSFGEPNLDNGRFVQNCRYIETSSGPNYIELEFEPDTPYQLRISKVGFESASPEDPAPKYVTLDERSVSVNSEGQTEVSAVVRDRYHNPVSGVELYANISAGRAGAFVINDTGPAEKNVSVTTDADGQATVTFATTPSFDGSEVTFGGDFDNDSVIGSVNPLSGTTDAIPENATVSVSRTGVQPITLSDATISSVGSPGGTGTQLNLTVRNEGTDRRVTEVKLNYATINEQKQVINETNTVTNFFNLLGDTLLTDVEFTTTNTTSVVDGPDSIESIIVDHPGTAAGADPLTGSAGENSGPVSVDNPSSLPAIPGGGTADIVVTLDESVNQGVETQDFGTGEAPADMLAVSITVEYSDGYRETYTTNLHAPEDVE